MRPNDRGTDAEAVAAFAKSRRKVRYKRQQASLLQNAGERAIRDWLVDTLPEVGGPALLIYEDKKMPKLIAREQLADVVVVATTRAMLAFAKNVG